jgi:hypothetical protein
MLAQLKWCYGIQTQLLVHSNAAMWVRLDAACAMQHYSDIRPTPIAILMPQSNQAILFVLLLCCCCCWCCCKVTVAGAGDQTHTPVNCKQTGHGYAPSNMF